MTYHVNPARFDAAQHFLTEDELRKLAPSVFATSAHPSRSEKFAPIATIDVLRHLDAEGFGVVGAQQSLSRRENSALYAKHMLRIRQKGGIKQVGDSVFEAYLRNANDGTGAYDLMPGIYRVLCQNSAVAMTMQMDSIRVRHAGRIETVAHKVIDATYSVVRDADRALEAPDKWSRISLDEGERLAFAEGAHTVRFADQPTPVQPVQLLEPRRAEDTGSDLWSVFNRVQENVIRGGVPATRILENGQHRRMRSRAIKGIDTNVSLNKALWTLAERMVELKAA